ncbi:hypothetical protein LCGC14_1895900 [marine sediment metagenome]|uniref:Uncharacterized protein n=1 Tax=marine sediment metagenome TaxID=412755 RepID=A0A0F9IW81_9ZZZZ
MSDKMRWRYGNTNPVMSAVDSATVIEIGDLLYHDTDDAKPALIQKECGSEVNNQCLFASTFLGVAMQCSRAGDTDAIRVAISGVFEFDCTRVGYELGDFVAPDQSFTEEVKDGLCNQQVTKVDNKRCAIARVSKRTPKGCESVLVEICSTIMRGGIAGTTF